MESYILEMQDITKTFPGVVALDKVNFKVKRGEIHCLVGENGAGKSTLMKVLAGIYPHGEYEGSLIVEGEERRFRSVRDSQDAGIAIISQELALIPELTAYENIFFGNEIMKGSIIDWNRTIIETRKILKRIKLDVDPSEKVGNLRVGHQQLVEIGQTLSKNAKILILDEPTSSLNETESTNLLHLLRSLKDEGVTIIMISHRLGEVIEIADTITVLRDGTTITSIDCTQNTITERYIIKHMVGRDIENIYPERDSKIDDEVIFEVRNWSVNNPKTGRPLLKNINLNVRKGEIVGLSGLMGAGRTELALSLFGNTPTYQLVNGEILIEGQRTELKSPKSALEQGIAYVTEDRKRNGLILGQDVKFNITISNLSAIMKNNAINEKEEIVVANYYKKGLDIRTPSVQQKVINLSGGNQQKVSLARQLFTKPKLLILDEPTRGIDVGAKFEIYSLMNQLVAEGMSIIMISSELLEIIGMSDRVYVMSNGIITGELHKEELSEQSIMELATITNNRKAMGT
ncbi:MAG: sugar ABC transporter ATP-binding protein [Clostridiaceae bacterium]|nr:sugar ABC transporter ATP-binding protein [Clostridiaceae bacterium]